MFENLFRNKKGTEKPIEIFIALFIILAVALVMLKVFNEQLKQQQSNMDREQQKVDFDNHVREVQTLCSGKCATAQKNGCRDDDVIEYCMTLAKSTKYVGYDLNNDNYIEGVADYALVEYCEDNLYCPQIPSIEICPCKGGLTMDKCGEVLRAYLDKHPLITDETIYNVATPEDPDAKVNWGDNCAAPGANAWIETFESCFDDGDCTTIPGP